MDAPKRKGRPPKPDSERRRRHLTFRLRDALRDALAHQADEAGRSISEEIEYRLEQSIAIGAHLEQTLQLLCGPDGAAIIRILAHLVRTAPALSRLSADDEWINDPSAFDNVARQLHFAVEALRPPGVPESSKGEAAESNAARLLLGLGDESWNPLAALRQRLTPSVLARLTDWREKYLSEREEAAEHWEAKHGDGQKADSTKRQGSLAR